MASVTVTPGARDVLRSLSTSAEMLRTNNQYETPTPRVATSTIAVIARATRRSTPISVHEWLANDGLELVGRHATRVAKVDLVVLPGQLAPLLRDKGMQLLDR